MATGRRRKFTSGSTDLPCLVQGRSKGRDWADLGQAVVVGVNRFTVDEEKPVPIQHIDESLEPKQVERLRALRARRNQKPWQDALKQVEDAARSGENLLPRILTAVEALATVGEISDTLRRVFGEYEEAVVI